jgi:hypothetical protein
VRAAAGPPEWWWLTDADGEHAPDTRAAGREGRDGRLDLVSLMVRLDPGRGWNALLVPAFVYFFQQLYPFRV